VKDELLALATRVEALTGPDRGVDEVIARLLNWCPLHVSPAYWEHRQDTKPSCWFSDAFGMPAYTACIAAALSLVPEVFSDDWCIGGDGHAYLDVDWRDVGLSGYRGYAATPALALVATALRAQAQEAGHGD
jgi:hypothetical protein